MLRLNLNKDDGPSGIGSRIENIYERIAGNDDYQRNDRSLKLIQSCVITVSAVATGCVNAFAHKNRIGWIGAGLLAVLIIGFVERFYFTLRHGLQTTYKSGTQRLAAMLSYRALQITMSLNAAVLCVWIAGERMPPLLDSWNRYSIVIHFMLALIGVTAVRDTDDVATHRRLELKAETARQDLLTLRKAAALGNPLVLIAAKLRGLFDGVKLARQILSDNSEALANYGVGVNDLGGQENLLLPGSRAETANVTDFGKTSAPIREGIRSGAGRMLSSAKEPRVSTWQDSLAKRAHDGARWGSINGGPREGDIREGHDPGEQCISFSRGSEGEDAGEQPAALRNNSGHKAHLVIRGVVNSPMGGGGGADERFAGESEKSGEQESIAARGSKVQGLAGRDGNRRGSGAGKAGEQSPPVISLLSTAPVSRSRQSDVVATVDPLTDKLTAAEAATDERDRQWLKALLPEAASGWWDVYPRGKGFAVKFCWRDQGLQKLTFPRISIESWRLLRRIDAGEARGKLRAEIEGHLRSLFPDPAKSGKASAAAAKLGIDPAVPTVHA